MLLRWIIGDCLRRARHAQDRTLREVAQAAGVSTGYLSEVERGRKEASSEVLAAVCRALGLELLDLVGAAHGELVRWSAVAPRPRGASRPSSVSPLRSPSPPSNPPPSRATSLSRAASLRGASARTRGGPALAA